ncbi:MAG: CDGSH iron-sulfur domain-containing protein [archaeon]|jgi:CDGSH-type Zn-finger protein
MQNKRKANKIYSKKSSSKENLAKFISITPNGPYLVSNLPLDEAIMVVDMWGAAVDWEKGKKILTQKNYALCRCGHSKKKPFCSGAHNEIGFNGKETAGKEKFSKNAEKLVGVKLKLLDKGPLCNHSGFCTVGEGVWDAVENATGKKEIKKAVKQICDCPTGRLVVIDKKTNKEIEPKFEASISLIKEPEGEGAIWVKGSVEIKSSDGKSYEKRNRVCLCRCGKSRNKPFCDGSHLD